MGVGTYRNDFNGAGVSFMVSGPTPSEEDYNAYLADRSGPSDEALPFEQFCDDAAQDARDTLLSVVRHVANSVGLLPNIPGMSPTTDFDRDVLTIASDDILEIGWRSWQHDFVVAIGPTVGVKDGIQPGREIDGVWAIEERGRSAKGFGDDYFAAVDGFAEMVRAAMTQVGMDTRVATSSYTSDSWVAPAEDLEGHVRDLGVTVKATLARLGSSAEKVLAVLSSEERLDVVRTPS